MFFTHKIFHSLYGRLKTFRCILNYLLIEINSIKKRQNGFMQHDLIIIII